MPLEAGDPRWSQVLRFGPAPGTVFRRKPYRAYSPDWQHDHCAACWATLAEIDGPRYLHEGYATTAEYEHGEDYDWLCVPCFELLKEQMQWRVA